MRVELSIVEEAIAAILGNSKQGIVERYSLESVTKWDLTRGNLCLKLRLAVEAVCILAVGQFEPRNNLVKDNKD